MNSNQFYSAKKLTLYHILHVVERLSKYMLYLGKCAHIILYIVQTGFVIDHRVFFPYDLHVYTLKSSCFFSYVGIQMVEKVSHIYPNTFNYVSGHPQGNYQFCFFGLFFVQVLFIWKVFVFLNYHYNRNFPKSNQCSL